MMIWYGQEDCCRHDGFCLGWLVKELFDVIRGSFMVVLMQCSQPNCVCTAKFQSSKPKEGKSGTAWADQEKTVSRYYLLWYRFESHRAELHTFSFRSKEVGVPITF